MASRPISGGKLERDIEKMHDEPGNWRTIITKVRLDTRPNH